MKLETFKNNLFVRGSIWLSVSGFTVGFLNYLFNSLSSKALGPSGYAEISTLFAYLSVFSIPIGVLQIETIRRIGAKSTNRLKFLARWLSQIKDSVRPKQLLILMLLYSSLILILPPVINLKTVTTATLLVLLPLAFLNSLQEAIFKSLKWFKILAVVLIAGSILKTSGAVAAYLSDQGILLILASLIISTLLTASWFWLLLRNRLPSIEKPNTLERLTLAKIVKNKPLVMIAFSYLGFALLNNLDMIVAKRMFSPDLAGVYGAWDLLSKMILYIAAPVSTVSLVFFSYPEYKRRHLLVLLIALLGQLVIGILSYLGYVLFGEEIIKIIFTVEYLPVLPVIGLAAFFGLLYTQIGFINNFFMANKSYYSLILPILVPFYALAMILWGTTIERLVWINLAFGGVTLTAYVFVLIRYQLAKIRTP